MRVPISGICTGFRIIKGHGKDASDYAKLDILQVGDKNYDSALIFVFVQDIEQIEYLLTHYSSGTLKWIDIFCIQIQDGREKVWLLKEIFHISKEKMIVEGVNDGY